MLTDVFLFNYITFVVMKNEILVTADGSNTLRHPILGELYHSDRGAIGEANHVYIGAGFNFLVERGMVKVVVLEVGFGSGLNCWLTLQQAHKMGIEVIYHAIELYPISIETASELNFSEDPRFSDLHKANWDVDVEFGDNFTLTKHNCSLETFDFGLCGGIDLVYFDAFAPDIQPEMWSSEVFSRLYGSVNDGGVLVTYTSKGIVKQNLRSAGFSVNRMEGALGKRHMVRASRKGKANLDEPARLRQ